MTTAAMEVSGTAGRAGVRRGVAATIVLHQMRDVLRSRWLVVYGVFFAVVTDLLLRFSGGEQALVSIADVVLFVVPLVTLVFGTMYLYDARDFIELLLAQPVRRRSLFTGVYLGLLVPLAGTVALGVGVPFAVEGLDATVSGATLAVLIGTAVVLSAVFTGLAALVAVRSNDKVRGLGGAIALWLVLTVVYDGVVLLAATMFADHPLEVPMLVAMAANPVDLARVLLLLRFDIAALTGYTGAVLQHLLGGARGAALAVTALGLWVAVPSLLAARSFRRKDF